jgi:hypothetical protein
VYNLVRVISMLSYITQCLEQVRGVYLQTIRPVIIELHAHEVEGTLLNLHGQLLRCYEMF